MSDKITLTGISGFGFHGVFESEKRDGQIFLVDLEAETDFSTAAASDDVSDTVNYATLADIAHKAITGEPFNLIEKLADQIAQKCLALPGVQKIRVTVHKPQAPIEVPFGNVSVTQELS